MNFKPTRRELRRVRAMADGCILQLECAANNDPYYPALVEYYKGNASAFARYAFNISREVVRRMQSEASV